MKKLLTIVTLSLVFITNSAFCATLDERIAKVETKYEQKVKKIAKSRYTNERKEVLTEHAKQNKDLKIKQMRELASLKSSPAKNTKK